MSPPAESARARIREQLSISAATSAKRRADRRAATPAKPHRSAARALKSRCFGGLRDLRRAQLRNALAAASRAGCCAFAAPRAPGARRRDRAAPPGPRARGIRARGVERRHRDEPRAPGFADLAKQGAKCRTEGKTSLVRQTRASIPSRALCQLSIRLPSNPSAGTSASDLPVRGATTMQSEPGAS